MKYLDEQLAVWVVDQSKQMKDSTNPFAVRKKSSVLVLNNHWLLEWRIDEVDTACKAVRRLLRIGDTENTKHRDSLLAKPTCSLLAPIADLFFTAEEVEPTDDELYDGEADQFPCIIYKWDRNKRTQYCSLYYSIMESVIEEPASTYVYADNFALIFISNADGKKLGYLASTDRIKT